MCAAIGQPFFGIVFIGNPFIFINCAGLKDQNECKGEVKQSPVAHSKVGVISNLYKLSFKGWLSLGLMSVNNLNR